MSRIIFSLPRSVSLRSVLGLSAPNLEKSTGSLFRMGLARFEGLVPRRWTQSEPKITFQPTGLKVKAAKKKETGMDWFATRLGRRGALVFVTLVAGGVIVSLSGPHTYGQQYIRQLYQHHTHAIKTKVSKEMEELIREVMTEADLTDAEAGKTQVFVAYPLEAASWGTFKSSYGALIGYPNHLHYASPSKVELGRMRLGGGSNLSEDQLGSAEAKSLKQSLCLSREAKKFAIARELENCRIGLYRRLTTEAAFLVVAAYACSRLANLKLGLFFRPRLYRALNYAAVGSVLGLVWVVMLDRQRCTVARQCDEAACRLGPDYCNGGVEYYDKILQRHVALRTLMPDGKKLYNRKGDFFPGLIRIKVPPVSQRRETCLGGGGGS